MKQGHEVWARGNATAVFGMDVKRAFAHVAKGNLITRIKEMKFEANLVRWMESFMEDRKVIELMDRKKGDIMEVLPGVLQWSPVSWFIEVMTSVSNGSKLAVQFRIRIGTKLEPLQQVLPHQKSELHWICGFLAGSTVSHTHYFGSNSVFQFWSYHTRIYM